MNFLNNRTNIWIWRQAFASLQHGFLRSEENVVLYNFETPDGVWKNVVSCNILTLCFLKHVYGRCCATMPQIRIWYRNVKLFQQREKLECKMTEFQNHRRFLLKCLSDDILPVSIRLKSNIKTPEGLYIIKKVERALLNERIRLINTTITMFETQRNTGKNQLNSILDKETREECVKFINCKMESRHIKTLERQRIKFNQLCHRNRGGCSNIHHGEHGNHDLVTTTTTMADNPDVHKKKWVTNISSKPLTEVQESLLAHGPNFAIVPRNPHSGMCYSG